MVVGQVEEDGGSADCDPGRLVVLFQVECLDTLTPAGPRAPLSSTTRTQFPTNHEEPFNPTLARVFGQLLSRLGNSHLP